jgi:signal transduction histidine kinase
VTTTTPPLLLHPSAQRALADAERPIEAGTMLGRMMLALSSTLSLREVLDALAQVTLEECGAGRVSLFEWRNEVLEPAVSLAEGDDEALWQSFRDLDPIRPTRAQAEVLSSTRALAIEDPHADPLVPRGWAARFGLQRVALVPLRAAKQLYGLLVVDYPSDHTVGAEELGLLQAVADAAGVAVRNARLFEAVQRRAHLGGVLSRAAQILARPQHPQAVAACIAAAVVDLLDCDWVGVGRLDRTGTQVDPLFLSGPAAPGGPFTIASMPTVIRRAVDTAWTDMPRTFFTLPDDPWLRTLCGADAADREWLVLPLLTEGSPAGAVLAGVDRGRLPDMQTREALTTLAVIGGGALERADLLRRRDRQARQFEVLHQLGAALSERADAEGLVSRLNDLLSGHEVTVTGVAFRDRQLVKHLAGDRPVKAERELWGRGGGPEQIDDFLSVPMRLGTRIVGGLRVQPAGLDPERFGFIEAVALGVGEVANRGALRSALEQASREHALAAERERIARDLHDTVGQASVALTLIGRRLLDRLPAEVPARTDILRMTELAEGARWQVDQAIRALAFVPAARRSLTAAIRGLCRSVEADSEIGVVVQVSGKPRRLGSNVERALYRVTQEALVNAWRHARCGLIRVELRFCAAEVTLEVVDDGTGLGNRIGELRPGMGMTSMHNALAEVDGRLRLRAVRPHGVALIATVPTKRGRG